MGLNKRLMVAIVVFFGWMFSIFACNLVAQDDSVGQDPGQILNHFVGEWRVENEGTAGPDQAPIQAKGKFTARKLGERWVVIEMAIDVDGTTIEALQTIGYNSTRSRFEGTWVDSMQEHLWTYEGTYDEKTKTLALIAEGPSMMAPSKTQKYRDAFQFVDRDTIKAESSVEGADGNWTTYMQGTSRRVK